MIIYIAGKMAGLPDKGHRNFVQAENRLRRLGNVVINPGKLPIGLHAQDYMRICLDMIDAADAVYMLNNWTSSAGATLERAYAQYQGKRILRPGNDGKPEDAGDELQQGAKRCPYCGGDSSVEATREDESGTIRRLRKCVQCGKNWSTMEIMVHKTYRKTKKEPKT